MTIGGVRWRAAVIVCGFVLPVFLFAPLRVFLNNTADFTIGLPYLAAGLLLLSTILAAVLYAAGRRWPGVLCLAAFLGIVAFLESTIFLSLAAHRPFDGRPVDWSQWRVLPAVELGVAAAVGLLVVAWRRREHVWYAAAAGILLFQGLSLGHAAASHRGSLRAHAVNRVDTYLHSGFHRLSRQRNVIHVVLDTTQGAMVYDIVRNERERYSKAFDGFTLFTQAMGMYPSTYPSVPYFMSGIWPDPGRDFTVAQPFTWDYVRQTLKERSIVGALAGHGYRTFGYQQGALYCTGPYDACAAGGVFDGVALETDGRTAAILHLLDVALFQATPLVVRRRIYNDGDWLLKGSDRKARTYSAVMDAFVERASADAPAPTYNYFHLAGGHGPLQFDQRCAYVGAQAITYANQRLQVECALGQIARLIALLERLGVYDQTMIVVNGDHGTPGLPPSLATAEGTVVSPYLIGTASALLMVKPFAARAPLAFSDAPASIGDIPATLDDALGLGGDFPGVSVLRIDGAPRERQYLFYDDAERVSGLQALPNLRRYRVRGSLYDPSAWVRPVLSEAGEVPSALWMDDQHFERHATGFTALEMHSKPARWVLGTRARVRLSRPTDGPTRFVLECYVPPPISAGQTVAVSVNGTVVATIDDRALDEKRRHAVPIPDAVSRRGVNTIDLEMGRALPWGAQPGPVSMVVAYIGLEPDTD